MKNTFLLLIVSVLCFRCTSKESSHDKLNSVKTSVKDEKLNNTIDVDKLNRIITNTLNEVNLISKAIYLNQNKSGSVEVHFILDKPYFLTDESNVRLCELLAYQMFSSQKSSLDSLQFFIGFQGLSEGSEVKYTVSRERLVLESKMQIIKLILGEAKKDDIIRYEVILEKINLSFEFNFSSFWELLDIYADSKHKLNADASKAYKLLIKGAQWKGNPANSELLFKIEELLETDK